MRPLFLRLAIGCLAFLFLAAPDAQARKKKATVSIPVNDRWDVLRVRGRKPDPRKVMAQAGKLLGDWKIELAGMDFDGPALTALAERDPKEPFLRVVREGLKRPIDLWDFLLFVDDVLRAGKRGLRGKQVWVPPGRARSIGINIHPDDVFKKNKPRKYPHRKKRLNIDRPRRQLEQEPCADGALLGPCWTARYKNPRDRHQKWKALARKNPSGVFTLRFMRLVDQLEAQGGDVGVYTTVRNRHRGYLMWGSFMLSRKKNRKQVLRAVQLLQRLNHEWKLDVPIRWYHPGGWRATVEAARIMADTYDVVYASRAGAMKSRHYDGEAIDVVAFTLPRSLTLKAPDGAEKTFDLSDPQHTRDLSLSPEMIEWVEEHFQFKKLKADYPHWDDAAEPDPAKQALALAEVEEYLKPTPKPVVAQASDGGSPDAADGAGTIAAGPKRALPMVEAADKGQPTRPWPDWTLLVIIGLLSLWTVLVLVRTVPHLFSKGPLFVRSFDRLWLAIPFPVLIPLFRQETVSRFLVWVLFVFALSAGACVYFLASLNWPLI